MAKTADQATGSVVQADLSLNDLAQAILARTVRPQVASVRRLAEAVLAAKAPPADIGPKKGKKSGKPAKSGGKKRKSAKAVAA